MNLCAKLAWQQLTNHPRRTAGTLFGIVLAVGMLVAVGGFGVSGAVTLDTLLRDVEGLTGIDQVSVVSYMLALVLGLIVAFAGMIVISNTFRVSALDRAKQFGILKSVGASKNQIRATVLYEGLFLLLVGLPLGVLAGFGLYLIALVALNTMVDISAVSDTVRFSFEVNPLILAMAVGLSVIVVLVSAWLPAAKAAKTPAIQAIKGTNEIAAKREKAHKAGFFARLFGFEGMMASKQLKRSRRHFRATVISITTSVVLILASVSLSTHMGRSMEGSIAQMGAPSVLLGIAPGEAVLGMDAQVLTHITRAMRAFPGTQVSAMAGHFYAHPDHGIALVFVATADDYEELLALAGAQHGDTLLINVHMRVEADGHLTPYNPNLFTPGDTLSMNTVWLIDDRLTHGDDIVHFTIGGVINELPDHFIQLTESRPVLVVPEGDIQMIQWGATTPDPDGFLTHAFDVFHRYYTLRPGEDFIQLAMTEAIQLMRITIGSALAFVRIFAFMLIFLGLTNVISTIATSVKLRQREFAILTSVGMENSGLRRMLAFESLLSAARALTFGLPLGFASAYLMYQAARAANPIGIVFTPPWLALVLCAVGVVVVTFFIMQVAATAVKRNNIIESIRGE